MIKINSQHHEQFHNAVTAIAVIKRTTVSVGMLWGVNLNHTHQHSIKKTTSWTNSMFPGSKSTLQPSLPSSRRKQTARSPDGVFLRHSSTPQRCAGRPINKALLQPKRWLWHVRPLLVAIMPTIGTSHSRGRRGANIFLSKNYMELCTQYVSPPKKAR